MADLFWKLVYADGRTVSNREICLETGKPPYIGGVDLSGLREMQVLNAGGLLLACVELPIGSRPIAFKRRAAVFGQTGPVEDAGTEFFFGYQVTENNRNRKVILSVNPDGVVRVTEDDGRQ